MHGNTIAAAQRYGLVALHHQFIGQVGGGTDILIIYDIHDFLVRVLVARIRTVALGNADAENRNILTRQVNAVHFNRAAFTFCQICFHGLYPGLVIRIGVQHIDIVKIGHEYLVMVFSGFQIFLLDAFSPEFLLMAQGCLKLGRDGFKLAESVCRTHIGRIHV